MVVSARADGGFSVANGVELAGWYHKRYAGPGPREGNLPRSRTESGLARMITAGQQRWEVHDRYGNRIYMTTERWQHIVDRRPWLGGYHRQALETIRRGRRRQDPLNPVKYKYYWPWQDLLPEFNHMVVVVLFGESVVAGQVVPNNYATTAWPVFIYSKA